MWSNLNQLTDKVGSNKYKDKKIGSMLRAACMKGCESTGSLGESTEVEPFKLGLKGQGKCVMSQMGVSVSGAQERGILCTKTRRWESS